MPGGADFGAMTPITRPTNKTAPTPSEKPATRILPTAKPKPIAKNTAMNGCEFSRAPSHSMFSLPASADAFSDVIVLGSTGSEERIEMDELVSVAGFSVKRRALAVVRVEYRGPHLRGL